MKKKTHEEYVEELQNNNPDIIIQDTYVNSSTKIKVTCRRCNYTWYTWPLPLLKGHGCPQCANNIKKSHSTFVQEMREYNPNIEIIGKYQTALTPIKVKCNICGNEWMAKPSRLLNGLQCMNCIRPHTSFMEQFILLSLQSVLGSNEVESRNKTAIGNELDIYIPAAHVAIEPGSWLYHQKKVDGIDRVKREKCKEAGIRLITIYDSYPNDEKPPFENDCFVFSGFLNEPKFKRIIALTTRIISELGYDSNNCDWKTISSDAYAACHYKAHDSFINDLQQVAPNIEVLEEYKGTNIPILVRSRNCNHPAWKTRPCSLLRGSGCPICGREKAAKKRVRSNEQFIEELSIVNPDIIPTSKYTLITDRINVQCRKCGYEWNPLAYSLLSGKGCPHCSALSGAKKRTNTLATKTTDQFKDELRLINPTIKILGTYKNNKTKILAKCLKCGHEWNVVPASLLNGHGCPICFRTRKNKMGRKSGI